MDRREVINRLIQCSLALLVFPSRECFGATLSTEPQFRIKNVAPGYDVNSLGKEYLRLFPKCRNRAVLIDELYSPGGSTRTRRQGSSVDARIATELLSEKIARDFDMDATLRIGGWFYAQTELKLCALQSMALVE